MRKPLPSTFSTALRMFASPIRSERFQRKRPREHMPISDEELLDLDTFHPVTSVAAELLMRNDDALRRRIQDSAEPKATTRAAIQRASERRIAEVPGVGKALVQLFGMPLVAAYDGQCESTTKQEVEVFRPNTVMQEVVLRIWRSAIPDPSATVVPLPRMLHINAAVGISPSLVHSQVFRGATLMEGQASRDVPMSREGAVIESARGPTALVYLMLAYVVTPVGVAAPSKGNRPAELNACSYMQGWLAHPSATPEVSLLPPMRFFDAVDAAQLAQLKHFLLWCARHRMVHALDQIGPDPETAAVRIEGWYQAPDQGKQHEVAWAYDSTWREPLHLATVMSAAEAAARVDPRVPGPEDRMPEFLPRDPLH